MVGEGPGGGGGVCRISFFQGWVNVHCVVQKLTGKDDA
jgi:hypothetical protein